MAQGKKEEAEAVKAEVAQISKRLTELEPLEKEYQDKVLEDMMKIPNIIDPSVSIGKDDVNYLTELKEEELKDLSFKDPQSMMQNPESFSAIMDKLKEKYSNRSRHE